MGDELEARLEEASTRWPGLGIDRAAFRRRLNDLLAAGPVDHLGDLYLAFGCAVGDEGALRAFHERYDRAIRHAVARAVPSAMTEEAVQQVLTKLFVEGDRPPVIARYEGRGKLSTWIQVVARREASTLLRWDRRHGGVESDPIDQLLDVATRDDAVLTAMKQAYRARFAEAFREALEGLSPRERNLLRYECVDGLNRDAIAAIYGVSRATVARWRTQCRDRLYQDTRRLFSQRLAVDAEEFQSVVRMIESQLHVSLTRILGDAETDTS